MQQTQQIQRADGSTVTATIQTLGRPGSAVRSSRLTEPVVDPAGNVTDANISTLEHSGLTFVRRVEGRLVLTEHARKNGIEFYRDMCLGRLPEVDASEIHWRIYRALTEMAAKNQRPAKGTITDEQMWHPEVLRRRREAAGGVKLLDKTEMEALLEELRADDGDLEQAEAQAKALGIDFKESAQKPLAELLEEQKKKKRSV